MKSEILNLLSYTQAGTKFQGLGREFPYIIYISIFVKGLASMLAKPRMSFSNFSKYLLR